MFTKWIINIEGLEGYRVSEDGDIYKIPFVNGNRAYEWRLIKKQYPNRWRLDGEWFSKTAIWTSLIPDPEPIEIYKTKDVPF